MAHCVSVQALLPQQPPRGVVVEVDEVVGGGQHVFPLHLICETESANPDMGSHAETAKAEANVCAIIFLVQNMLLKLMEWEKLLELLFHNVFQY
jgi:hypothetical protein